MPPRIKRTSIAIGNEQSSYLKRAGEIRKSQIVGKYGPGSLLDFPRISAIMCGIDDWEKTLGAKQFGELRIYERNLQKILDKNYFIQAESFQNKTKFVRGIQVARFPQYCYCPECGRLDYYYKLKSSHYNNSEYNSDIYCSFCKNKNNRNVKLVPSRFVVACENGHIEDFPYNFWVHKNQSRCENPRLFLTYSGNTGGLESIHLRCECGAKTTMQGCMDANAVAGFKCHGAMPWLGKNPEGKGWFEDREECNAMLRVLQRTANNVYYPVTISALTIPPYSSHIQHFILSNTQALDIFMNLPDENMKKAGLKVFYDSNADRIKCGFDRFMQELRYAYFDETTSDVSERTLKIGEYNALCDDDTDEEFFKTSATFVPESLKPYIKQIKIVNRLREVRVIYGFKRINPTKVISDEDREEKGLNDRECAPLSRTELDWLPAIELFGEGIFIEFNEEAVQSWEKSNISRYKKMLQRYEGSYYKDRAITPNSCRYVMLHTFAHLLIRKLSEKCGYVSASLKEKIYASTEDHSQKMCGILIYTAATDSDGSLGGLAREGKGDKLNNTILEMLNDASWCSTDPICIESKSQGFMSLNYSACHACTLLPETSCECVNILLDRASVVGSPDNHKIGFMSDLIWSGNAYKKTNDKVGGIEDTDVLIESDQQENDKKTKRRKKWDVLGDTE